MIALLAFGCAYHVTLHSQPTSALVRLPDGTELVTPARLKLRWVPFGHQWVTVSASGYRSAAVDLQRHPLRWGRRPPPDVPTFRLAEVDGPPRVEILLVPEHGPAGTWSAEDVP